MLIFKKKSIHDIKQLMPMKVRNSVFIYSLFIVGHDGYY